MQHEDPVFGESTFLPIFYMPLLQRNVISIHFFWGVFLLWLGSFPLWTPTSIHSKSSALNLMQQVSLNPSWLLFSPLEEIPHWPLTGHLYLNTTPMKGSPNPFYWWVNDKHLKDVLYIKLRYTSVSSIYWFLSFSLLWVIQNPFVMLYSHSIIWMLSSFFQILIKCPLFIQISL